MTKSVSTQVVKNPLSPYATSTQKATDRWVLIYKIIMTASLSVELSSETYVFLFILMDRYLQSLMSFFYKRAFTF